MLAVALLAACGVFFLGAGRAAAADPDDKDAAKARKLIEKNESVFAGFAHPTPTLVDVEYGKPASLGVGKGFTVICKFNYKDGFPDRFWSKLEIEFDRDGDYVGVKGGASTGFIGPFKAGETILAAFRDELLKDPDLKKVPGLADAVKNADLYALLKACLKPPY